MLRIVGASPNRDTYSADYRSWAYILGPPIYGNYQLTEQQKGPELERVKLFMPIDQVRESASCFTARWHTMP